MLAWAVLGHPRPVGCYNVRVELSPRKQRSHTETFLLRRKDKTLTVLFCELLYYAMPSYTNASIDVSND